MTTFPENKALGVVPMTEPYDYNSIRRWLNHWKIPDHTLTDAEAMAIYSREARARVLKLRDDQLKEIFCHWARRNPQNNFAVSLAGALVSASEADFVVLRSAALLIIERHNL